MTNAEAIKIINQYDCNFYWTDGEKIPTEDLIEAFELAVKALDAQTPRVLTMPDRNDTIERLRDIRDRAVVSDGVFTERAAYMVKLIDDVLGLLKEQEPRVLTLEEVEEQKQSGGLWLDSRDNDWTPMAVLLYEVDKKKVTFMSRSGLKFYANKDKTGQYGNYGTGWRCWTSRPTDEQRRETPWEG